MHADLQPYFERSDKWHYKLLLQELYRNCVLSSHDTYSFIDNVQNLDVSVTNFPGLDIRDMINELMIPYKKEYFVGLVLRTLKHQTSHTTQNIAENVEFSLDKHHLNYEYHTHLFNTLRDCLAIHGAFNLSKAEKEHGYELQE